MEADSIKPGKTAHQRPPVPPHHGKRDFAKLLARQGANRDPMTEGKVGPPRHEIPMQRESAKQQAPVLLGTITQSKPTVSHLLMAHSEYGRDCWGIIDSQENRHKPVTKIKPGTAIFLDPATLEITWAGENLRVAQTSSGAAPERMKGPDSTVKASIKRRGDLLSSEQGTSAEEAILLGTITRSKPTVSHLLIEHGQYGKDCWRIIHANQNRHKPYTQIKPGTAIFLDPETLEISWDEKSATGQRTGSAVEEAQFHGTHEHARMNRPDSFSTRLANAAEAYIGRSHEEIDCYELVVRGLVRLGIRYHGTGGLRESLVNMAIREGRPRNAYFNGEGLIEASGTKVYAKSFLRIKDAEAQAREVMKELRPLLQKGLIVSFSTHSKGHTGIVSRKHRDWTFINSGKMDHHLEMGNEGDLVGEETLSEEMKNWFALAASRKESLKITVGRLDEKKLVTFHDAGKGVPEQA